MNISIPDLSLVVLIGVSGSGKSTFARRHFAPTEVLSSDFCRGIVSNDENDQAATNDAFDVLHYIVRKRLKAGLLTVVDATNVHPEDRALLVEIAREHHCLPVAIVLDLPERICHDRNATRPERNFGPHVIRGQRSAMRRGLGNLRREGFRHVFTLCSAAEVDAATIERTPLWNNRRQETGPFDIIGDVHGCYDELIELLARLGHLASAAPAETSNGVAHPSQDSPPHRRLIFLGDLCDRGPSTPAVYRLVMGLVAEGRALCIPGNHDEKLLRKLRGKPVQITHGLGDTLAQLENEPPEFRATLETFLDGLVSHYVLDAGRLVVAHAGLKEEMQGRASGSVREFCLYGETTGESDEFGLPVRLNWAEHYRGRASVVYGHTPVPEPQWLNNTINIDTGCVFGGRLTALRYPERELVTIPARATYAQPKRPFLPPEDLAPALTAQQAHDDVLDIADVTGKRIIDTTLAGAVTIRPANAAAALEVMSRFAADPRWLIYLPPTMSPCETSFEAGLLEHPREAFAYYRNRGIGRVICEEKHMGSRAIVIACRDADAARRRFGISSGESGICYTRTGRRFFDDPSLEETLLSRIRAAADRIGWWDEFKTDWMLLDCELMPWSAKAQSLLSNQYAAVGAAATLGLNHAVSVLQAATQRVPETGELLNHFSSRHAAAAKFIAAYRRYCWPVSGIDGCKLAPFHLLATQGACHTDKDHSWHMQTLAKLCAADMAGLLLATPFREVDLTDGASESAAIDWWTALTSRGGEGMVVKPFSFISRGTAPEDRGVVQPAVKCRGPEYLRIIYGPEYDSPAHIERLRTRNVKHKRALALREFALGVEALVRFTGAEPLRRIHECVFGVLSLESEPVDPRL